MIDMYLWILISVMLIEFFIPLHASNELFYSKLARNIMIGNHAYSNELDIIIIVIVFQIMHQTFNANGVALKRIYSFRLTSVKAMR